MLYTEIRNNSKYDYYYISILRKRKRNTSSVYFIFKVER